MTAADAARLGDRLRALMPHRLTAMAYVTRAMADNLAAEADALEAERDELREAKRWLDSQVTAIALDRDRGIIRSKQAEADALSWRSIAAREQQEREGWQHTAAQWKRQARAWQDHADAARRELDELRQRVEGLADQWEARGKTPTTHAPAFATAARVLRGRTAPNVALDPAPPHENAQAGRVEAESGRTGAGSNAGVTGAESGAEEIGGYSVGDRVRAIQNIPLEIPPGGWITGTVTALDLKHGWRVWVRFDGGLDAITAPMDPDDLEHATTRVEDR